MEFHVRFAKVRDAGDIARVHVQTWRTTYAGILPDSYLAGLEEEDRAQLWREHLSAHDAVFLVAEHANRLVGFACGGKLRKQIGDYTGEIYAIYVLQDYQGQRVGRELMGAMARELRKNGLFSIAVWVLAQNPAISFYRRLGAELVTRGQIQIGGETFHELAFGWPDSAQLCKQCPSETARTAPPG